MNIRIINNHNSAGSVDMEATFIRGRRVTIVFALLVSGFATVIAAGEVESQGGKVNKLGDPGYRFELRYFPIYGRKDGSSYFLHYCLPKFLPAKDGECFADLSKGKGPNLVEVEYAYPLKWERTAYVPIEGHPAFNFPFAVNENIDIKNPYAEIYREKMAQPKEDRYQVKRKSVAPVRGYEGLDWYEAKGYPGGWWIPSDLFSTKTRMGNPPMFICFGEYCSITIDEGNGWIVSARFHESALKDWKEFYRMLNESIDRVIEEKDRTTKPMQ